MTELLSKFDEQKLVMVNYACGYNQSETGKYSVYMNNDSKRDFDSYDVE